MTTKRTIPEGSSQTILIETFLCYQTDFYISSNKLIIYKKAKKTYLLSKIKELKTNVLDKTSYISINFTFQSLSFSVN